MTRILLKRLLVTSAGLALVVLWAASAAHADTIVGDPLHGFCWGVSTCTDMGTATPVSSFSPLDFGFSVSPGPQTGSFSVDILIPVALDPKPSILSFAITGTKSATAILVSTTAFSSGDLATYLGISVSSPANPIGGFQAAEAAFGDGSSTDKFYVYQASFGSLTLQPNATELSGPLFQVSGVPLHSTIVGFLNPGSGAIATALSGQIITTPEPGTLSLLGTGLLGLIGLGMFRRPFGRS